MAGGIDGVDLTMTTSFLTLLGLWGQTVAATIRLQSSDEPVERSFSLQCQADRGRQRIGAIIAVHKALRLARVWTSMCNSHSSRWWQRAKLLVDVDLKTVLMMCLQHNQFEAHGRQAVEADVDLAVESIEFFPDAIDVGNTLTVEVHC